jgi:hypothetical protein
MDGSITTAPYSFLMGKGIVFIDNERVTVQVHRGHEEECVCLLAVVTRHKICWSKVLSPHGN